jgi:hypothetical protein
MVKRLMLSVFLAGAVMHAWASDEKGNFSVKSVGMAKCSQFIEEQAKGEQGSGLFLGWMDGYISAANQFNPQTYDLIPWGNTLFLGALLEGHCKQNPDEYFYVAVNRLAANWMPLRIRQQSPIVESSSGDRKVSIYQEIIQKMQGLLMEGNYYQGPIDGDYNENLKAALEAYQQSAGLEVTGLPDFGTLQSVFLKPASVQ